MRANIEESPLLRHGPLRLTHAPQSVISELQEREFGSNLSDNLLGFPSVEIRFARSATRHRVSRERSRYVVEHCGLRLRIAAPDPGHGDRFVYLGDDADGIPLEVIAIELGEDEILVIHAMPLRPRFREQYEEVTQWRV